MDLGPSGVAFNPSSNFIYVVNIDSVTVSVIDSSTNTVVDNIIVGSHPVGVAFNPSNNDMYVTDFILDTVYVIDSSTNTVVDNIIVGSNPIGMIETVSFIWGGSVFGTSVAESIQKTKEIARILLYYER